MPRDHDEPDGPRLELWLKRVAPSEPEVGQLWHITGGPGDSGLDALRDLAGFQEQLAPGFALLSLDVRGDPTMPLERARDRAEWLDGPNQTFVAIPEAFHVTLNQGDCPASIYEQFLSDPFAALDLSCIDDMSRLGFAGDPERDLELWGTEDRWGEGGCSTSPGWMPLAVLVALLSRRRSRCEDESGEA